MAHRKNKHHHKPQVHAPANAKNRVEAKKKIAIIFGILGIIAAALAAQINGGFNWYWIVGGALIGSLVGYFIGQGIDKAAQKKK